MVQQKQNNNLVIGIVVGAIIVLILLGVIFAFSGSKIGNFFFLKPNKIAVIDIIGEIGPGGGSLLLPGMDLNQIISDLEEVEKDESYGGVLIKIDSPGGTVVGSRTVVETLKSMTKPTVCWLGDEAASGAYWIASACKKIVADPLTLTGSIGATASYLQYTGLFQKYGIEYQQIVSGKNKDTGTPYRNLTEEEKTKLQYIVDESFRYFLEDVSKSRKLTKEQIEKVKTGDIFLAKDAINFGLVDKLGTLKDARDLFKEILGAEPVFVSLKHQVSLF